MTPTWITTDSGHHFDIFNPRPEDITLRDIALGLSRTPRFRGQTRFDYWVAQHSILVSNLCANPEAICWALLHDAAEVYLFDAARPIKHRIYFATDIPWLSTTPMHSKEGEILHCIAQHFHLDWSALKEVKEMDSLALEIERRRVLSKQAQTGWGEPQREIHKDELSLCASRTCSPRTAYKMFLTECRMRGIEDGTV